MAATDELRAYLALTGRTQGQLAQLLGVSLVTVNAWMNGRAIPRQKVWANFTALCAQAATRHAQSFKQLATTIREPASVAAPDVLPEQLEDAFAALERGEGAPEIDRAIGTVGREELLAALGRLVDLEPVATLDAALLLDAAKDADASAVDAFLTYPLMPLWAHHLNSELDRDSSTGTSQAVAEFQAFAAAAAILAGIPEFSIRVDVDGPLHLFSIGTALLPPGHSTAIIRSSDGTVVIDTPDVTVHIPAVRTKREDHWIGIPSLRFEHNGLPLQISLDDQFPYRHLETTLPGLVVPQLDDLDVKTWKSTLDEAWALLVDCTPMQARAMTTALHVIVPLELGILTQSVTYNVPTSAILLSPGSSAIWSAQVMLDAFTRSQLNHLDRFEKLHTATSGMTQYLPPHRVPPCDFGELLRTAYSVATTEILSYRQFLAALGTERTEAAIDCGMRRAWTKSLCSTLERSGELTRAGRRVLSSLRERAASLDPLPSEFAPIIRRLITDRRLCARLTNVSVDAGDLDRLAVAWEGGESCPVSHPARLHLDSPRLLVTGWKRRRQLAELRHSQPDRFAELVDNQFFLDLIVADARNPDVLSLEGNHERAEREYCALVIDNPDDIEAWAGLATTHAIAGFTPTGLGRFPEIVYSLYRLLRERTDSEQPLDPLVIAIWLEPLLVRMDDALFESEFGHLSGGWAP